MVAFPKRDIWFMKKIKKDTVDHWQRMINYIEKAVREGELKLNRKIYIKLSEANIKKINLFLYLKYNLYETLGNDDCPLCQHYYSIFDGCKKCLLNIKYGSCGSSGVKNLYRKVVFSKTVKSWLKNAKRFLKQIEEL